MIRLAAPLPFSLALAALAVLGACSTPPQTPPQSGAPAPRDYVTNVHPYRAGSGTVQSVITPTSAATGATSGQPMQRLEVRMDDGSIQYIDTSAREFTKGSRIVLGQDRQIRKL